MVTQQLAGHAGENPSLTKTCTSADEIRQYIGENQKQLKEIAFNEDKKRKVLVDEALLKTLRPDDMTPEVQNVVQREVAKMVKNQRERTNEQVLQQKRVTQKQATCKIMCLLIFFND